MSFDWKGALKKVAPTIGGMVGGPLGKAAIQAATSALLGPDKASTDEQVLATAMESATPADYLKLKEAENSFALEIKKLDLDFEKVDAADRSDARAREIALKDWYPKVLASGVMIVFAYVVYMLSHQLIPDSNRDMFNQIMGIMYGAVGLVLGYYFGSSSSSRAKDEILHSITNGK